LDDCLIFAISKATSAPTLALFSINLMSAGQRLFLNRSTSLARRRFSTKGKGQHKRGSNVLRSKACPPLNSPTRFNNHGVASFPLLSIPCSRLSLIACSTASWTLSPVAEGRGGTAKSVAKGLGRVRPVSTCQSTHLYKGRTDQSGSFDWGVDCPW